jgi:hypothetical protein
MATALRSAESALDAIARTADDGLSAQAFIEQVAHRMERVVPTDGYFLAATDPETTLSIGLGVVSDLPAEQCGPTWDHEFLVPDFLKYADIVRSGRAVADIHEATGGRPERSPRFREYSASTGYRAEVRLAFTIGEAAWGIGQLNRAGADARFTEDEKAWLERAAPLIARGLRRALLSPPDAAPAIRGAGIVLLDRDGGVVSATRQAAEWLDDLDPALLAPGASPLPLPFQPARWPLACGPRTRAASRRCARGCGPAGACGCSCTARSSRGPTSWRSSSSRPRPPTWPP